MDRELLLNLGVGLARYCGLLLQVVELLLEVSGQGARGQAAPPLAVGGSHAVVGGLFLFELLVHLLDHLEVVIADPCDALDHALHVTMAALLLEVLDLVPQGLGDVG